MAMSASGSQQVATSTNDSRPQPVTLQSTVTLKLERNSSTQGKRERQRPASFRGTMLCMKSFQNTRLCLLFISACYSYMLYDYD